MNGTRTTRVNRVALRDIRERRKLSQMALSETTGIAQSHISRLEAGLRTRVRAVSLRALATALDVQPEELIDQVG